MVDFEDGNAAHARQAVRPRVEPGPEDDELFDGLYEGGRDRIIDKPGACDYRGTYSRPSVVDQPGHELRQTGSDREPGHEHERPRQESPRKGIREESSAFRQ